MDYRNLGASGVKVSPLCLGTAFRAGRDEATCLRVIECALEQGCNFIDTANIYGGGRSERILARALKGKRDDLVLTSKVSSPMGPGPNEQGLSRYAIMREVERSLRRLETDHLDIYILHQPDPTTPMEETLRAMDDLVHQGKIRYVGISNYPAWEVCDGLRISQMFGLAAFILIQAEYSLLHRWEMETQLMPLCRRHGLGIMVYSPLAVGLLTGAYSRNKPLPPDSPWANRRDVYERLMARQDRIVQALVEIGQAHNKTPTQVALAWVLDHPEVSAAIIGPDEPAQVEEDFGALGWQLDPEECQQLDAISQFEEPA